MNSNIPQEHEDPLPVPSRLATPTDEEDKENFHERQRYPQDNYVYYESDSSSPHYTDYDAEDSDSDWSDMSYDDYPEPLEVDPRNIPIKKRILAREVVEDDDDPVVKKIFEPRRSRSPSGEPL